MDQKKILIIDDEPEIVGLLAARLNANGYATTTAFNGTAGAEKALEERPDLILLDIMMPEVDGLQTLRKIKENEATKDIPVVMVSAKVQSEDQEAAKVLGAVDFVAKPYKPDELMRKIKEALSSPE